MVVRPPNKSQNVNSGEETSPAAPSKIRTRNLSITSPALYRLSYPDPLLLNDFVSKH